MSSESTSQASATELPLAGVNVLDFGWAFVGALTGKFLGDHGADVIRVESASRPDMTRLDRSSSRASATSFDDKPLFAHLNTSKRSLTLNLKSPRVREVIEPLILWADVVAENFTPGTLAKLGLGYEDLKAINPRIIMLSSSVFGQTGPLASEWGIDGTGAAASGRLALTGWPDRPPVTPGVAIFGDYVQPLLNSMAIVAALIHRDETGEGQWIETSMVEMSAHQILPAVLDLQANGIVATRDGNRVLDGAPHGVFPCLGDDRWAAISVRTDEDWARFVSALGNPTWTQDAAFSTWDGRMDNQDALEALVGEWTSQRTPQQVMETLQSFGVVAAAVQTPDELFADPQLASRGFLADVDHPHLGAFGHITTPLKLTGTPARPRPAPGLGEHSEQICREIVGLSDEQFVDLIVDGVIQ